MHVCNAYRSLGFCIALAWLSGCGASTAPPAAWQPAGNGAVTPGLDSSGAWIGPDMRGNDLLYISDVGTGVVDIYTYPQGELRRELTGFKWPGGLCVDRAGDVYVTDLFGFKIVEYRHGASKPMRTIRDPNDDPGDCAVDPRTGNLAVTNVSTPYSDPGDVLVFDHAKGRPHRYKDKAITYFEFCTYDDRGNLFVDGMSTGNFKLAELRRRSKSFREINLDQKITYAGAVQWDRGNLAVGDYESKLIYQFNIIGTKATKVGETHLKGSNYPIAFWIRGTRVIAPNDEGANVMYWNYPQGGKHIHVIRKLDKPWGAAVSPKG